MADESPYKGLRSSSWAAKTDELVTHHPLDDAELVEVVQQAWSDVFSSKFGSKPFEIGVDLFPKPQILAFLLHELIPLELNRRHPCLWRGDTSATEKDLVHIPDQSRSVEIKASSNPSLIFGNRSYAQKRGAAKKGKGTRQAKKSKSGYVLAINFEALSPSNPKPRITMIRFGWLDHSDWRGQRAATGQQASLPPNVLTGKLKTLYARE